MAYTVLARKYRSRNFEEVIGQEPIATTLVNAIKADRVHHGFLFTGTRGVGKTSMARILAKALNCLNADAPTTEPCCECDACIAIGEGQDIDVVEIDAASNTGVDNIRELRGNAAYRPARSRYKIYIIDEVHMLSTGAFNALLKTLEEPPEHVKFILATTEIQKVPATIQSRCQRYNFRNISPDAIAERLAGIAKDEGAQAEPAVLRRVARLANGSMRDALSILDQLLSLSGEKLTIDLLDEILPPAQDEQILTLLKHAAAGDAGAVLRAVDEILSHGRALEVFCNDAIATVRTLLHIRICGADAEIVDIPAGARDEYVSLSAQFEESQYVQMIAMLEQLRRNVRFSGAGRALTDALMVRFARMREWAPIEQLLGGSARPAAVSTASAEKKKSPDALVAEPVRKAADRQRLPGGGVSSTLGSSANGVPQTQLASVGSTGEASAPAGPDSAAGSPVHDASPETPIEAAPGNSAPSAATAQVRTTPIDGEERERILKDPVVRQVIELFDGIPMGVDRIETVAAEGSSVEAEYDPVITTE
ncbi:MAG: DNA polymerase III subunit gamma/tau [Planctomycetes bacterium]|nr:DNA polymerase III subunit gamma/tau [Planctomycetota bacterium]